MPTTQHTVHSGNTGSFICNYNFHTVNRMIDIRVVSVVEVLVIIQYSALVVRSGYTGNVVVLRVACTKW